MAGTKMRSSNDQRQYPTKKLNIKANPATIQHNIDPNSTSNELIDKYEDQLTGEITWMNEQKLNKLIDEMKDFALNQPDALKISLFLKAKGISTEDIANWKVKWPRFAKTYQFCKEAIGDRRELGALYRKLSEGMVLRSMAMYDPEWKADRKEVAELKNEQDKAEANKTIRVVVDRGDK